MGNRGFLKGLLAGGLIGAIMGLFAAPQLKPEDKKRLMRRTRQVGRRAEQILRKTAENLEHMLKKDK